MMYDVLTPLEDIPCIHFISHIIQATIVAVGDDGIALTLEGVEVVDHLGAKEGLAIFQRGLVDNDIGTLGLHALHDALDGALAEIVRIALHRQAEDTNGD